MSIIYFIGGTKGVGKSTIISEANKFLNYKIIHSGTFFSFNTPYETAQINLLETLLSTNNPTILDTHYAGFNKTKNKYLRGLEKHNLQLLNENKNLKFILITSSYEEILNRRINDKTRTRDLRKEHVIKEALLNNKYFNEYIKETNNRHAIINNKEKKDSINELIEMLR